MKLTEVLTHVTHVNWQPAVYMGFMSQKFPFVSRIELVRCYQMSRLMSMLPTFSCLTLMKTDSTLLS